jgi:hypothetical protein
MVVVETVVASTLSTWIISIWLKAQHERFGKTSYRSNVSNSSSVASTNDDGSTEMAHRHGHPNESIPTEILVNEDM